eukprot:scaffold185816_cov26-Tisochrysis_lutea.AAC.2
MGARRTSSPMARKSARSSDETHMPCTSPSPDVSSITCHSGGRAPMPPSPSCPSSSSSSKRRPSVVERSVRPPLSEMSSLTDTPGSATIGLRSPESASRSIICCPPRKVICAGAEMECASMGTFDASCSSPLASAHTHWAPSSRKESLSTERCCSTCPVNPSDRGTQASWVGALLS